MVYKEKSGVSLGTARDFALLIELEEELFIKLEKDYSNIRGDIKEQANIVYNFRDSRLKRVPWLEIIGFLYHVTILKDKEI